jgi:CHAD domain-containing protein
VLRFGEWIERRGWRGERRDVDDGASRYGQPARELAAQLLARRQRKARKRGREFADMPAAERHKLRIALKKLRYTAEFFASLYPRKRTDKYVNALKRLQDDLGDLNDLAVAERLLDELFERSGAGQRRDALQRAAGLVLGWHAHRSRAIDKKAVKKWTAFVDQKPFWS